MKTLFKKLRASTALERGTKASKQSGSGEAERFEESLRSMDRNLREFRAGDDVPPGLHDSVMRAVRTSGTEEPSLTLLLWRRLAVMALVLVVGGGVFWSLDRAPVKVANVAPSTKAPPSFAAAFEHGHELTQAAPNAVLGPLSGEMDLLNRDLQNALNFVSASVP